MTKVFTTPGPCSYNASEYSTIASRVSSSTKSFNLKKSRSSDLFNDTMDSKQTERLKIALKNHRGYTIGPGEYNISGCMNKKTYVNPDNKVGFMMCDKRFPSIPVIESSSKKNIVQMSELYVNGIENNT